MPALILSAILLLVLISAPAAALSETDVAGPLEELNPEVRLLPISLHDCLCIALANSLDIEVQKYEPRINAADILSQKGVFDPHVFFNATYVDTTVPLPSRVQVATGGLTAVLAKQWTLAGGLTGAIPSGLTYEASITSLHTPSSTITDFFGTNGQQEFETVLTVSQPLLKNFGIGVNTTGIRAAEKAKEASVYQLEQAVMETVFAVEQAYWNLAFAYENLRVKANSLHLAQNLLEENKVRLQVGVVAPLAVLQSETGASFREEELIAAQAGVEQASDTLVSLINLFPGQMNWDVQVVPTDELAVTPPGKYLQDREVELALRKRPELWALVKQREAAELQAKYTKNQLLPSLNLNGMVGLTGLDSDFNSSFLFGTPIPPYPETGIDPAADDLFSGDNFQWSLGFTFEIPLGARLERGQYRAATLQVSQLDTSIQNLRLLIVQDVRGALRQIQANWEQVQAARVTTDFRRKSLDAQRKKYDVGATTTFDLLQYENELAQAEADSMLAQVQYRISLSNLHRATGTLLEYLNVRLSVDP